MSRLLIVCLLLTSLTGVVFSNQTHDENLTKQQNNKFEKDEGEMEIDCDDAVQLHDGVAYEGTTTGAPSEVDYYSCSDWLESGPEVVHVMEMADKDNIKGVLECESGIDLDLFLLSSCSAWECIEYGQSTDVIRAYDLDSGTYYVVVDGYWGDEGEYSLTLFRTPEIPDSTPTSTPTGSPIATLTPTPTLTPTETPYPTSTSDPTALPSFTPAPSPTIETGPVGAFIKLNSAIFRPGDMFDLRLIVHNPEPEFTAFIFLILDVHGSYFFWPGWKNMDQGIDYSIEHLESGHREERQIMRFFWPSIEGADYGLLFMSALFDPDKGEMRGVIDYSGWGYEGLN